MNYKDTIIKEIKWNIKSLTQSKDGKIDLKLNIPLTQVVDAQAKTSFAKGVQEGAQFILDELVKGEPNWKPDVLREALKNKLKEWSIE
jgi:hypothetical protein